MLIPAEKIVIQALDHDIRRTILRLLQARAYSFSDLMKVLNVPSGKLNYHLSLIAGFIRKNEENGMWESTILGVKAVNFLDLLESNLTVNEISCLCEAYVSQMTGIKNFQQFRQSYLKGTIDAINLLQRLMIQNEKSGELQEFLQELPNHLSELEVVAKRRLISWKRKSQKKTPSLPDPKIDYRQGVYDTFSRVRFQFFTKRQSFPQLLSRMEKEVFELLRQLGMTDFDLKTFSKSTKIGGDLFKEFSQFETEG